MLDKANLVSRNLCRGKTDYKTGAIFYGLLSAPKIKYVLTKAEYGIIQQHMTFKGFIDSKRLLNRSQYLDMLEGKTKSAMFPRSCEKLFNNAVVIPERMRRCNNCNGEILINGCNNHVKENKEFEANLISLKGHAPNHFGYMLPYYVIKKLLI